MFEKFLHFGRQILLSFTAKTLNMERFRHLDKVRVGHPRRRVTLIVEEVLPLLNHALEVVVEDQSFDSDVELTRSHQLHARHAVGRIAVDVNHNLFRRGELGTDRSGETVAHRPEASGGDHGAREGPAIVLCRPHLVLTDACGDENVVFDVSSLPVQFFDDLLGFALGVLAFVLDVREGVFLLPSVDHINPFSSLVELNVRNDLIQDLLAVSFKRDIHFHSLIDVFVQQLHMNDASLSPLGCSASRGRKAVEAARHAIVEPRSDGDDAISILNRIVSIGGSVHAEHVKRQLVIFIEGT
mmetsp:Transcript_32152/g.56451  ORF Transcript_32152/g.56451 Transcript_32152/m.56451 type:complete len:298 (+) Transcript_32152:92-985(+)